MQTIHCTLYCLSVEINEGGRELRELKKNLLFFFKKKENGRDETKIKEGGDK